MDCYFEQFDGQAVTTEDFVKVMAKASGIDLSQFEKSWYNQPGTPTLDVSDAYDAQKKEYKLTIRQSTSTVSGYSAPEPFHIPVRIGLLDKTGKDMSLKLSAGQSSLLTHGDILNLKENETTFVFENIPEKPTPSILRNWSAPVKVNYNYTRDDLMFLMAHDSDGFNRWEAGQKLGVEVLKELVTAHQQTKEQAVDPRLIQAFKKVLGNKKLDPQLVARTLALPDMSYLAGLYPDGQVDVDAIYAARKQIRTENWKGA